jgi:hypothetical protein
MCLGIGIPLAVVGITLFGLSWLVKKSYLTNKKQLNDLQNERDHEFSVAQSQLADLKSHICNYLTYSIFEQTYPLIQFARYFSEADYLN